MNGTKMESSNVVGNSTTRQPSLLTEGFSLVLCLFVAFVILVFLICAPFASGMLTTYSREFLAHWRPHYTQDVKNQTLINSLSSKDKMLIFNPKIKLDQVLFRRDPKEGNYKSTSGPLYMDYDDVKNFTDGEITNSENQTIYVEQDAEQINSLLIEKIAEREAYESELRKTERAGIEPGEMEGAE